MSIGIGIVVEWIFRKVVKNKSIGISYLSNVVRFGVYIIGGMAIINTFDTSKTLNKTIIAGGGIIVGVLGLAGKEAIGNVIDGLFISIFQPFNIGDRIVIKEHTGNVEDITVRHTVIRTFNNNRVIVPNSVINSEIIVNSHFREDGIKNNIDVLVSYDTDLRGAIKLIQSTIEGYENFYDDGSRQQSLVTGESKVTVMVQPFESSGIMLRATVISRDIGESFQTCSDLRVLIKEAFDANNIEIPYNKIVICNEEGKKIDMNEKKVH